MSLPRPVFGAGLGFRRELLGDLSHGVPAAIDFFELAPENWAGIGGRSARQLRAFTERHPFVCHGLSLSPGGPDPLDRELLRCIRDFMREHGMALYTEHLAWTSAGGQLYDLLNTHSIPDRSSWPRSPKGLSDQLRRIAPAYRAKGIEISHLGHSREGALWRITPIRSSTATPPGVSLSVGGNHSGESK